MSDVIKLRRAATDAVKYNDKTRLAIPEQVLALYPTLKAERDTTAFAAAVADIQGQLHLEADGFFGPSTQQALMHAAMPNADFLVINGQRVLIDTKGLFTITDFTENAAYDLHKYGNFSKRKKPVSRVVLHHGGYNVAHLATVLSSTERKVSTHMGLDIDKDGNVRVAQYLDLQHCSWHAGPMNEGSIGVDFAMQPTVEHQARYGFKVVNNPSSIGPKQVLEFPDATIAAMAQLVAELHRVFNINGGVVVPMPGADIKFDATAHAAVTVMGHHHFATNGKFDVAYLFDRYTAFAGKLNNANAATC